METPFGLVGDIKEVSLNERQLIVFDIETVRRESNLVDADEATKKAWACHCKNSKYGEMPNVDSYLKYAGLFPEFGFICAISMGYITDAGSFAIKSWKAKSLEEEKIILREFANIIRSQFGVLLVGHTITTFDIPWVAARMAIHGIKIPDQLLTYNKPPHWVREYTCDIKDVWTGGKSSSQSKSLSSICFALNIPTPKDGISGADVGEKFWGHNNLEGISNYCEKDVEATYHCYLKMKEVGMI